MVIYGDGEAVIGIRGLPKRPGVAVCKDVQYMITHSALCLSCDFPYLPFTVKWKSIIKLKREEEETGPRLFKANKCRSGVGPKCLDSKVSAFHHEIGAGAESDDHDQFSSLLCSHLAQPKLKFHSIAVPTIH